MDEFEKELKTGFLQEAQQLLTDTEQCFLSLESNPDDASILEQIFRLAHNLKGSSKAVGFDAMGAFTHEFESLLLKIKNGEVPKTTASLNLLLRCNDHLRMMVETLSGDLTAVIDSQSLIEEIKQGQQGIFAGEVAAAESAEAAPASEEPTHEASEEKPEADAPEESEEEAEESISPDELNLLLAAETKSRLQLEKDAQAAFDAAVAETEKAAKDAASAITAASSAPAAAPPHAPQAAKPSATTNSGGHAATDDSIRVSLARLEKLLNFVGEMVILQSVLNEQSQNSVEMRLKKTVHQLGKVTKEVQDISMSLRMVPVKTTFQKMQRIVRDTAQLLGKKVSFQISGEETELDKTVLEHLGDPLVHIIRNAVDHGIESNEKRAAAGKPETGNVSLSAYHQGGRLVIEVKDDGGGINGEVLTQKAIEKGLLRPGTKLSEKESVNLIFHPGFSTKSQVTEVSGRGVGMDVVKTNIEKLQGEVQITTVVGQGSTFKIFLPLTLAIIDGMVVTCREERYIIPLAHVHESLKPSDNEIQFCTGIGEVLILRGENLPLYRLDRLLGKKDQPKSSKPNEGIAIVVRATGHPFAVYVDDIIGQQQIVIKRLGQELAQLKGFSGSAILGDGRPSLILELPELIQKSGPITGPVPTASPQPTPQRKTA